MKTLRGIQICALLVGLSCLPALAVGDVDPDPGGTPLPLAAVNQIWYECVPVDLEVHVTPIPGQDESWSTITLTNYSNKVVDAELRLDVVTDKGDPYYIWTNISVDPGDLALTVHYFVPIKSSTITVCGQSGIGIIESPDPILSITPPPPPPGDVGGGDDLP